MNALFAILALITPIILSGSLALFIKINQTNLRLLLALSAAYLFSISIMHLLPEAYAQQQIKQIGLFIVLGFCLQLVIDTFSTGIEHGHVHLHSSSCKKHLPYGIIVGLMLHSFLEGLPIYNANAGSVINSVNYQLILGLGIHNIPISIAFISLLREHNSNKQKIFLLLILFSIMTPLGYLFSIILHTFGLSSYHYFSEIAFAVVIGIFLHLSTAILFETSEHHKYNYAKVAMMVLGIVLAYLMS